ncbi:glycosyltransferase family 32 protein [Methylovulum psychrotolerans]|uniref:Glycosyl transferase n=1 Tax=Methylovulum psychrotolerans TaxID=1704499 RepID=A0A2S5CM09_9GAMM|nr:glycosyltransferase [Methylovulum psychrotolerans]POZ51853.1 hypothetical protein AADEFJLK_02071 [Methylovulum psychrotolerans]
MNTPIIPKKIIQFWHSFPVLPDVYQQAMAANKANNPDFETLYVNDEFMLNLIKDKFTPCLLDLYKANKIAASRSDMARLILLYEYGGFYLDAALQLNASLNAFIGLQAEILLLQRDDMPRYQDCPDKAHVWNGMIGAKPQSEFIKRCIETQIRNLLGGDYNYDVRAATGPVVINRMIDASPDFPLKKLSFKTLKNGFLSHIRIAGLANSWIPLQEKGIIDGGQLTVLKTMYPDFR